MTHIRLSDILPKRPVLITGPTASGKSALALKIAQEQGGVIVNADASQVYSCWRIITARPSATEESQAPHALFGHIAHDAPYSTGHWLREVQDLLSTGARPIIIGGTGLYFAALAEGLSEIPATPPEIRAQADGLTHAELRDALDPPTRSRIDTANRARVQRGWEVLHATGRGLAAWQADTPPPLLPLSDTHAFVVDAPKDWLTPRIDARFEQMIAQGALDEVAAMRSHYDPARPAFRAIGVPELHAYLAGQISLDEARTRATIATRQYAKRQRTWLRKRCSHWHWLPAQDIGT